MENYNPAIAFLLSFGSSFYFPDKSWPPQVFLDYIHVKWVSAVVGWALKILTAFSVVALLYFNQHDIGITQACKDVWNIKRDEQLD